MSKGARKYSVGILNTSISTRNTGDHIIMESALRELLAPLRDRRIIHFPTHEKVTSVTYKIQKSIEYNIACGTNLLHSHMGLVKQWNVGAYDSFKMRPVVLFGVGWRSQEKRKTDRYTKWLLKRLLSSEFQHSVRDSYAQKQLADIGIENVLNTGCPTIWMLDESHCKVIPQKKGEHAVIVLTDYSRNNELDGALVELVFNNYKDVYFWCQGTSDYEYLKQLGIERKVTLIPPSLQAYRELLADDSLSLDYIGTRLHGGIFALQHKRRSVIIGVDHRANIKGKDFNLPVLDRYTDFKTIENMVLNDFATEVKLPLENIMRWKSQFS